MSIHKASIIGGKGPKTVEETEESNLESATEGNLKLHFDIRSIKFSELLKFRIVHIYMISDLISTKLRGSYRY
jgi:hypothetical protein